MATYGHKQDALSCKGTLLFPLPRNPLQLQPMQPGNLFAQMAANLIARGGPQQQQMASLLGAAAKRIAAPTISNHGINSGGGVFAFGGQAPPQFQASTVGSFVEDTSGWGRGGASGGRGKGGRGTKRSCTYNQEGGGGEEVGGEERGRVKRTRSEDWTSEENLTMAKVYRDYTIELSARVQASSLNSCQLTAEEKSTEMAANLLETEGIVKTPIAVGLKVKAMQGSYRAILDPERRISGWGSFWELYRALLKWQV